MTTLPSCSNAVARALVEIGAVGIRADNPITFKSGIISPVYVDNRILPAHPAQWKIVVEGFKSLIEENNIPFDVLAGVAVGGVPHASALGFLMERASLFIRKEAKGHGKGKRVEGGEIEGKRALLIEDLVTTGGSGLSAIQALKDEGAAIDSCASIVTYGFKEADEAFDKAAITSYSLTNFPTILSEGVAMGKFTAKEKATVEEWLQDPHNWRKAA